MNHEACLERLLDLAYGELPRREAAEVERHLTECEACRRERDRMATTVTAMRQLPAPPPPVRGDAVVLAAARRAAEERRSDSFGLALRGFGVRIAAGTAFALAAVFVVVNLREGVRPPTDDVAREPPPAVLREQETIAAAPRDAKKGAPAQPSPPANTSLEEGAATAPRMTAKPEARAKAEAFRREDRKATAAEVEPLPPRRDAVEGQGFRERSGRMADEVGPAPTPRDMSVEAEAGRAEAPPPAAELRPPRAVGKLAAPEPSPSRLRSEAPAAPGPALAQHPRSGPGEVERGSSVRREIERRHAAGELSEAQKRFEPCPGGDVRRTAWIDGEQRVLKLIRERADGAVVEEWFDASGRLREALVRGRSGSGPWAHHVTLGERGEEASRSSTESGLAPDAPPPPLVRRDPSGAFFSGPGCEKARE